MLSASRSTRRPGGWQAPALLAGCLAALLTASVLTVGDLRGRATVGSVAGFSPGGGFTQLSDEELSADLDAAAASGVRWVRVDLAWTTVERQQGSFDWAGFDRVVDAADARDLDVLGLVAYSPQWARPGCDTDKCPPDDPDDYARFAAAAAERYGPDRVAAWELWNEPNLRSFWASGPDADAYAALLGPAVQAVRAVRPDALLVSAGLSPAVSDGSNVAPVEFVERLYELDAFDGVDVVGIHPYSATALPLADGTEEWNTFLQMQEVYELMVANGDGHKQVWGTEVGVATGTDARSSTAEHQAEVVEQAFEHLGDRTWPWLGALFVYSLRDSADDPADWQSNFGLLHHDGRPKPAYHRLVEVLREPLADLPD